MRQLLFFSITLLVFSSCRKEKTTWDTDWSAPIISDTLDLLNLVNDSTLIESGGFYALDLSREIFELNIGELIEIPDTTIAQQFTFSTNLNVSPGLSFVNSVEEHELDLDDVQLKNIILSQGFIEIKVYNPLPTMAIFNVSLPGVSKNNVDFSEIYTAPAGTPSNPGFITKTLNLEGYTMDLTGVSGGDFNVIKSQVQVTSDPNGPAIILTPSDVINFEGTFKDVKVAYARGYFGNKTLVDTSDVFIEALQNIAGGSIDIPNTSIELTIENGIKVSAQALLNEFTNTNATGNTVALSSQYIGSSVNVTSATGGWGTLVPSYKTLLFNSSNSNVESYIGNLGANHRLAYSLQLNPWGNVSGSYDELFPSSRLKVQLKATMPLAIGVNDLIFKDTFDLKLNEDPDKTSVSSGELILNASNGFPIGGEVRLYLMDENNQIIQTVIGSSLLTPAQFGVFSTEHSFNVSNSEVRFLINENNNIGLDKVKKVIVEAKFGSPNPITNVNEPMSIPVGAFLAFRLKSKIKTEMKF